MSITKLIPCPTCGYPLDETEQKGLATLTERMVLVRAGQLEDLERGSFELNKSAIYYGLRDASAAFIHSAQWVIQQNTPDRMLTAAAIIDRDYGWYNRLQHDRLFKAQVDNFSHVQMDNIRNALRPVTEMEEAKDAAIRAMLSIAEEAE